MRCNAGINVVYLADSHLIAEQVELLMVTGMLRRNNYIHKTPIPLKFKLGTGHITFWFNKLLYLQRRLAAVKNEVGRRGFKVMERSIELDGFPVHFINDWKPDLEDSQIVRMRIVEKMNRKGPNFWRYLRSPIKSEEMQQFQSSILHGELFYV